MDIPPVTSLVLDDADGPHDPDEPQAAPPWKTPFLEVLGLLKIINNSQLTPKVGNQRFCFQPSHDLSEISRVFLSVTTSDLQYDIDLKTIQLGGSEAVPPAVAQLQEYANNALRRIRQFKDRLIERNVLNDSTCFLRIDMLTCPICLEPLNACVECDAKVACSNAVCLASLVVDCEQCFAHGRMACYECLKKNDTVPPLITCPMCKTWCCREDSYWCAGIVIEPMLGSAEQAELSHECDWDDETIVRSHPPKPSSCTFCNEMGFPPGWTRCRNSRMDIEHDRCPSQTPFMVDHRLESAFCPDCYETDLGRRCACGAGWLCEVCLEIGNMSAEYPYFITCPRCAVHHCTLPDNECHKNIDMCGGCKGARLCDNCIEEEELPGDAQMAPPGVKQVVLTEQCNVCEIWTCGDCSVAQGTGRCAHCYQWFCHTCVKEIDDVLQLCPFCHGHVCRECRRGRCCSAATVVSDDISSYDRTDETPSSYGPFLCRTYTLTPEDFELKLGRDDS